mgnify:CR=1 FL=1
MKIYQLILLVFLVVSCSDNIEVERNLSDSADYHDESYSQTFNASMDIIENNVKDEYQIVQEQLNVVQLELKKKTPNTSDKSLETLERIWNRYSVDKCDNEFPIISSRGSIALTENTLCLTTATELHTTELKRLLSYDLNSPKIIEGQKYSTAICSFYKSSDRKDCFDRIKINERIIVNLGNEPKDVNAKSLISIYAVNAKKAFIYKQPNINSKTSSYFIEGDEVKPLMIMDEWIKVSYLKDSKTGWLRLDDLEKKEDFLSSSNEKTSNKIKNGLADIQSDNSISSDQSKYIINKDGVGNIVLGQAFNSNKFEELEAQLEGVDNCSLTTSNEYPKYQHSLYFQFFDNVLTGVSISSLGSPDEIPFRSYTGVKIGDTIKTVMKLHNKQPDETLNSPHTDDPIFIYWTDSSKKTGMRYNTVNGEVSSMSLNYNPHIRYFEGCG